VVDGKVWDFEDARSNRVTPIHKLYFMKMKQLEQLESFTVEEFQENFDNLIKRVENGESFIIKDRGRSAVIVPYNETIKYAVESVVDADVIRIHTDHEEGS
jgi:prevent-host-death family protein